MELLLKRNEIPGGFGGKRYELFAKLELQPDELERIRSTKPNKTVLWQDETGSSKFRWRLCAIPGAIITLIIVAILSALFEGFMFLALPTLLFGWFPVTKMLYNQFRPEITVADLITGRIITCKNINDLYEKETAIRENIKNLNTYLSGMRPTTGDGERITFD